jgi:hypothetical protein
LVYGNSSTKLNILSKLLVEDSSEIFDLIETILEQKEDIPLSLQQEEELKKRLETFSIADAVPHNQILEKYK